MRVLFGLKEVWKILHRSLVSKERREGGTRAAIDMKEVRGGIIWSCLLASSTRMPFH